MTTTSSLGQKVSGLKIGPFATLCKVLPAGALQARKEATGAVVLYWRYSIGTHSERVRIGVYDSSAPPKSLTQRPSGFSLAAAVRTAESLAIEHRDHRAAGGRPTLLLARQEAKRAAQEAEQLAAEKTLKNLLTDYCDYLASLDRQSHRNARSIFKLHIEEAWPDIAAKPASQVTSEEIANVMRRLITAGKGRTANKLRSYARAAYQTAKAARSKPSVPASFTTYGITVNPVADTQPDEQYNKPDKRPLSTTELQSYWRTLKSIQGFRGSVLRLHLLTGGQRIEQLVKLKTVDVHEAAITLIDGKGRPGRSARPHSIPLIKGAAAALSNCEPLGEWALSTDGGETHLAGTTLSKWAAQVATSAGIEAFTAKRIRSGVETLLASARVSQDHRGRLQSHGISGVQARHYDGHEYLEEKREALLTLQRLLDQRSGVVGARSASKRVDNDRRRQRNKVRP